MCTQRGGAGGAGTTGGGSMYIMTSATKTAMIMLVLSGFTDKYSIKPLTAMTSACEL
jgi:hypothetical protein